eukprot:gene5769-11660_t
MATLGAYVPLSTYSTAFANVASVSEPVYGIPVDILGVFQAAQTLSVRQHVKLFPKACCSCPPCVKQENTYSIYAGLTRDNEAEFLRVDEVSDDWNRCCCTPYHPLRLEVRQYIPAPGEGGGSDWDHIKGDVSNDFGSWAAGRKAEFMKNAYKAQPVLFSMVRDDGQRCCYKCPCKVLSTFVCCDCCTDGMHIYAGGVEDKEKAERGRPYNLPADRLIGSVKQPVFGGWCIPTLHLRSALSTDKSEPFGKVQGQCCFGGWSEMCCDFKFFVSAFKGPDKAADIGVIVKKKPQSIAGAAQMLMTDSDNFTIEFANDSKLNASEKATVLAAQLLADYMYFDGNTEKCH